MRDELKRMVWLSLCCLFILLLPACESKPEEKKNSSEQITLYYLNNTEDGLVEVPHEMVLTEDVDSRIKEVLHCLSDTESDNSGKYKPSIYSDVIIKSIELEDREVTIDFESNYSQLSSDKEILLRSSVVKSLVQLEGVKSVTFTVAGDSLLGSDDTPMGTMKDKSFVMKRSDLYSRREKVTLYYANSKGNGLEKVNRTIEVRDNVPVETGMLNELIAVPGPEGTRNPLPRELVVNRTQTYNNICYVDLSEKIEEIMPDVEDRVKVYAMVNTLVDRGYVSQVQFTVEGKPLATLNDVEDFDQPLSFNYSLAGEKKSDKDQEKEEEKEEEE